LTERAGSQRCIKPSSYGRSHQPDGKTGEVKLPANATVINGTGKTVIPGLVMLHEHLYYTLPMDNYFNVAEMLLPSHGCTWQAE